MKNVPSIVIFGDFYPHISVSERLNNFNINNKVNWWFKEFLEETDLRIVNLESPLTESIQTPIKTGPALRGDVIGLDFLQKISCNMVTLANNHIMDYGKQGLFDTMRFLDDKEICKVGAGVNLKNSKQIKYVNIKDKKIAILNFAENEWSTSIKPDDPGASSLDPVSNFNDIQLAKSNSDTVLVITHGGHENYNLPSPRMKNIFRFFIDAGADAVVNHHPHCVSGYEIYKEKPIFYSVGNFIFENKSEKSQNWTIGMGVKLMFSDTEVKYDFQFFKQCKDEKSLLDQLTETELKDIEFRIYSWNKIISSDADLQDHFDKWVQTNKKQYLSYFEPHNFRLVRLLQRKNLLPSLWSSRKKEYMLNLVRCEAHRDVLISILENENSNT